MVFKSYCIISDNYTKNVLIYSQYNLNFYIIT